MEREVFLHYSCAAPVKKSRSQMVGMILVFAKPPWSGLSKTRLARDVGRAEAQRLNRYCHRQVMAAVLGGGWQVRLHVAPDRAIGARVPVWPTRFQRFSQGRGDLGERLWRAFRLAPPGPVLFLGTDAPDISRRHIVQAFRLMRRGRVVVGPADDGGFWLLGLHRGRSRVNPFAGVRWSSAHTLMDLKANLGNQPIAMLPTMIDLDDGDAVAAWRMENRC